MSSKRVHIRVTGRVQGVFYRANTRETAERLGLSGWVRNMPDGSVEIVAEGDVKQLKALVDWCHRGPPGAKATGVKVDYEYFTGEFETFEIRY